MELEIHLKDKRSVTVSCESYEVKEDAESGVPGKWLFLYRGGKRIGQYNFSDIVGYHELPPRSRPVTL
jgi:hypothetical protein